MQRNVRVCLILALPIGAAAVGLVLGAAPRIEGAPALLTGVEAERLLAKWHIENPSLSVRPTGVVYAIEQRSGGVEGEVVVGVFPSRSEAQEAFRRLSATPMAPRQLEHGGPGDDFLYWPPHLPGAACRVLLRRVNAIFSAYWRGSLEEALRFARDVDAILLTDRTLAGRGPRVPIPSVEVALPEAAVAGRQVEISFKATHGGQVRLCHTVSCRVDGQPMALAPLDWDSSRLVTEGTASVVFPKPGSYELALHFAGELNAMFTRSVTVNVIGPQDMTPSGISQWLSPGREFYFLRQTRQQWAAAPNHQREWLQLRRGTFEYIKEPAGMQEKALAELRQYIQSRWLPDELAPLLHVARNWSRPGGHTCFYASYKLPQGYNVALMGELGRQFWLYIEHPDPLPPAQQLLSAQRVLADDLLQADEAEADESSYPRAAFMVRTFRRYRAYKHDGPYERVRILFAHVQLPGQVNLRFPGYP